VEKVSPKLAAKQKASQKLAAKEKPVLELAAKAEPRETEKSQITPLWKPMGLAPADKPSISLTQGRTKKPDASGYSAKIWSALARNKPDAGQRGSTIVTFAIGPAGALRFVRVSNRAAVPGSISSHSQPCATQRPSRPRRCSRMALRRIRSASISTKAPANDSKRQPSGNILTRLTIRRRRLRFWVL
jgi:hypothetical protein